MAEFLCLANSWKDGHRCVAGLVPGQGWVRPVPDRGGSAVPTSQCRHFGLLDVVDVDLGMPVPVAGQRENRLLGPEAFSKVREHNPVRLREGLEALIEARPRLLARGRSDRISATEVKQRSIGQSLALVEPASVRWSIKTNIEGFRRLQCHFEVEGNSLDLRVTDPAFVPGAMEKLKDAPLNSRHTNTAVGIPQGQRLLLTASLGGDYRGNHYKLVAGVIALDR